MPTIVCAVDGGAQQPPAVALAASLARTTGAELVVATVYPWSRFNESLGNAYELTVREDAEAVLAAAAKQLAGVAHTTRALPNVSAPRALHALCEKLGAELLVIGSCHRGRIGRTLLGGVGDRLVHGAPCPVAVAPRDHAGAVPPRRVAVGYDGSDDAKAALQVAVSLAERAGSRLELVGVVEPVVVAAGMGGVTYPYALMEDAQRKACADALEEGARLTRGRVEVTTTTAEGPAAARLLEAAERSDVLVAGSRGYGPLRSVMLGTTGRALAHECPSPLILVPRTAHEARDGVLAGAAAAEA